MIIEVYTADLIKTFNVCLGSYIYFTGKMGISLYRNSCL